MSNVGPLRRSLEMLSVTFGYWLFSLTWATLDGLYRQLYSKAGTVETIVSWISTVFFILIFIKFVQLIIALISAGGETGKGVFGWIGKQGLDFGKWNTERHKVASAREMAKLDRKQALDNRLGARNFGFRNFTGGTPKWYNPFSWKTIPWYGRSGPKPPAPPTPSFAGELSLIENSIKATDALTGQIYAYLGSIQQANPTNRTLNTNAFAISAINDPNIIAGFNQAAGALNPAAQQLTSARNTIASIAQKIKNASSAEQAQYRNLEAQATSLIAQTTALADFFNRSFSISSTPGASTP